MSSAAQQQRSHDRTREQQHEKNIETELKRIADALEKIATAMEKNNATTTNDQDGGRQQAGSPTQESPDR